MYEYITIIVLRDDGVDKINSYYDKGWEFIDATAEFVSTGGGSHLYGMVYFTLRRQIPCIFD